MDTIKNPHQKSMSHVTFTKISNLHSCLSTVGTLFLLRYVTFFQRSRKSCLKKLIAPRSHPTMLVIWRKESVRKSGKVSNDTAAVFLLSLQLRDMHSYSLLLPV